MILRTEKLLRLGGSVELQIQKNEQGKKAQLFLKNVQDPFFVFGEIASMNLLADRCTILSRKEDLVTQIFCVEHLSAALLFVQNEGIDIRINHQEIPILDGSSLPWIQWFKKEFSLKNPKQYYCEYTDSWRWIGGEISVEPAQHFSVEWILKSGSVQEEFEWNTEDLQVEDWIQELLPARTFIRTEEFGALEKTGFFPGASEEMGLVVNDQNGSFVAQIGKPFRFPNECARHKVLDLIGDLALFRGALPKLKIRIVNGGHHSNHELLKRIIKNVSD